MKHIKRTGIYIMVAAGLLMTSLVACKKDSEFFDIEDPQGINSAIWNDAGAVGLFLNRTYGLVIPQWPAPGTAPGNIHITSDEMNGGNTGFLYGTLTENSVTDMGTANSTTANRYFDIRRCNLALEGLNASSTIPEAEKRTLRAQFYFLRGYIYFRLVNLYGGVPLILQPQVLDEKGQVPAVPRSKTSECIAAIVKDLDSASAGLPALWTGSDVGRITRATAMAMKGKVLMYWASKQFNPSNIASRWEDAYQANKAAYTQAVQDGYILLSKYSDIFLVEDNREVMLVRKYNTSRDFGTNIETIIRPFSESAATPSFQPTWNLVQSYPMKDGLPPTASSATYPYNAIQYWKDRDPRFEASIVYNGAAWPLSGKGNRRQWVYNGVFDESSGSIQTGFYTKRFSNPALTATQAVYNSNSGGGSGMDWIEMRFAELVLNLAECANETGRLSEAKDMVRMTRQRAGIVAGAQDYGMGIANDAAAMRTLILNERQVEFALEGKRHFDLRRTANFGLITARQSYKVSVKSPYVAGLPPATPDPTKIYLDAANAQGIRPRDTVDINNLVTYQKVFNTPGTVASIESSPISIPSKYYFYAIPNFFSQNSFVIEQTIGWINGTFDPLQ